MSSEHISVDKIHALVKKLGLPHSHADIKTRLEWFSKPLKTEEFETKGPYLGTRKDSSLLLIKNLHDESYEALQSYQNGPKYWHLLAHDPRSKLGGYKLFSHSIDLEAGKIVAQLSLPTLHQKQKKHIQNELRVLTEFHGQKRVLSAISDDHFVLDECGALWLFGKKKLEERERKKQASFSEVKDFTFFQTKLYFGDLSSKISDGFKKGKSPRHFLECAKAIQVLHKAGWVHRDIKPGNFFIKESREKSTLVIGDFGFAERFDFPHFGKSLRGTRGYMSPELALRRSKVEAIFENFEDGIKADIFSLGMCFYEIIAGPKNVYKEAVKSLATLGMPKTGANEGSARQIHEAHCRLIDIYQGMRQSFPKEARKFRSIVLDMCHPDPYFRPPLETVIRTLRRLAVQS